MSAETLIAWTDHTQNFWMGCTKVSDGCKHCYAETLTRNRMGISVWGSGSRRQMTGQSIWRQPLKWNAAARREGQRRRVFCSSLCDIFEDFGGPVTDAKGRSLGISTDGRIDPLESGRTDVRPVTLDDLRAKMFDLIRETPSLDWQLLTKRPENIARFLPRHEEGVWPNVWLGTSIEDMRVAKRADDLRRNEAVVRFISYEPALGPLDDLDLTGIDWIIYGGESGPGHRQENKDWARVMHRRCAERGIAFFHKQSAGYRTEMGIELDGRIVREYPIPRMRQCAPLAAVHPAP